MSQILQNAIQCPDGKIIKSIHRHDWVGHKNYFVDGGLEYFRSGFPTSGDRPIDLRLTTSDSIDFIKNNLLWGTFGTNGFGELCYVKLIDCTTKHLKKIKEHTELRKSFRPIHYFIINLILQERETNENSIQNY